VGAQPQEWARAGVSIANRSGKVGDVCLELEPHLQGFVRCEFALPNNNTTSSDLTSVDDTIDGALVRLLSEDPRSSHGSSSRDVSTSSWNFLGVDHVVITTDDLSRTSDEIERVLNVACARVRDAGNNVTQGFHKLENTIIEVVSGPQVKHTGARWWGFVLTVDDIDSWCSSVGSDVASSPRQAVQPGRQIATVRSAVDLGAAIAVMSPHTRQNSAT
jgi:hypothetical protein